MLQAKKEMSILKSMLEAALERGGYIVAEHDTQTSRAHRHGGSWIFQPEGATGSTESASSGEMLSSRYLFREMCSTGERFDG